MNLYPFEVAVDRPELDEAGLIEMIDVGGPALLRAAAKNFASVTVVARAQDYEEVLGELRAGEGTPTPELRRRLAAAAFARSAAYESAIARWFQREAGFPETFVPSFDRVRELPYGENPHQRAAYYAERGARTHLLGFVQQLQGKELSFNNLGDLSAARLLAAELDRPACVIVKHANPCGVAVGDTAEEAYAKALAADPVSAYGGVVVVNRAVTAALAEALVEQFVELLFAPAYDSEAAEILSRKPSLRVLEHTEQRAPDDAERDYRRVLGGLLVQDRDWANGGRESTKIVCGEVADAQWDDLLFAWRVVKHVTSNAIVLARGGQTIGIGAGQMSRVDAVRLAIEKAREHGHALEGAVLASDAFFPFADGPAARARCRRRGAHPAGWLEARRRGDRCRLGCGRCDALHGPPPLPALGRKLSATPRAARPSTAAARCARRDTRRRPRAARSLRPRHRRGAGGRAPRRGSGWAARASGCPS